ncbi:unnamed protein product [Mytilus edulis]|uniref:B box-type domain-containing protein n=1 Tax=Mytilus edulis TaxID=6550 RepID=A0A8S3TRZ7_MYTED|nr:unnamed protein product [Mytilus edulis]
MATSSTFGCGVCDSQHITKVAEHWCPECEEGLCPNCLIFHNSSKLSRGHGVISIENYKQLPPYITSIRQQCPDHDRKYKLYCPNHEVPCCPFCITTSHSKCNGLQVLEVVVRTSELSSQYEDMKQSLRDIQKQHRKKKRLTVKVILRVFRNKEINSSVKSKQVRQQINSHLDKLEEQAIENLKSTEDKVKHQIETLLSKLSNSNEEAEELGNIISAMSRYASDLQRFLGRKEIELKVAKSEEYISSLVEDGSLQQVTMNCSIDSNVSGILSSMSSLCTILTETTGANFYVTQRERRYLYNGCTINQSGKMAFVDFTHNKRLIILNADGTADGELKFQRPYDVASIANRKVVIIQDKVIQIIDLSSKQVEKTIDVINIAASGISYEHNKLVYCESGKDILMLKLTGDNPKNVIVKDSNIKYWNYIASFQKYIYHTNMNNNTISCYNVSGEKMWEFKDEIVVLSPRSVAVDKFSNIYVASFNNKSIVVLSPDGTQSRTLISKLQSWAIDIDRERNMLMVAEYPVRYSMATSSTSQTSIHDINVHLGQTLTLPNGRRDTCITRCTINQSGKSIFADFTDNKRLIFLNADGSVDGEIHLAAPYEFYIY